MTGHVLCILVSLMVAQVVAVPRGKDDCASRQAARVWSPIVPATVRTRVEPSWPLKGVNDSEGTIILDVWIDERGDVACVTVVIGMPLNDRAAMDAVRRWKFHPATTRGTPLAVVQQVRLLKRFS
jgi:TonB family protein